MEALVKAIPRRAGDLGSRGLGARHRAGARAPLLHGLGAAAGGAGEVGQRGGTRGSGAWDPTGTVVFPKNP